MTLYVLQIDAISVVWFLKKSQIEFANLCVILKSADALIDVFSRNAMRQSFLNLLQRISRYKIYVAYWQ